MERIARGWVIHACAAPARTGPWVREPPPGYAHRSTHPRTCPITPGGIPIGSSLIRCRARSSAPLLRSIPFIPYWRQTAPTPWGPRRYLIALVGVGGGPLLGCVPVRWCLTGSTLLPSSAHPPPKGAIHIIQRGLVYGWCASDGAGIAQAVPYHSILDRRSRSSTLPFLPGLIVGGSLAVLRQSCLVSAVLTAVKPLLGPCLRVV